MNEKINIISKHVNEFRSFDKVYLFGSAIKNNFPKDIDLLLVYQKYSDEILNERSRIESFFRQLMNLPIDITALSEFELEQTKFLKKLSSNYIRIK